MTEAPKQQLGWVNILKGGCILLVVLYHVVLPGFADTVPHLSSGQLPAKLWVGFNEILSPLRMPAFFFVSGLLAANAIINRPWKSVLTSRITNLFYLYFLWGIIQWLMIGRVSGPLMGEHLSDNTNAAWASSFAESLKLMLLAMSSSWYLYALGLFFLFARLFRRYPFALLLVAVMMNYLAVGRLVPGWGPESLLQYFVFFVLGAFYSEVIMRWSEWKPRNLLVWALLAVLAAGHIALGFNDNFFLCIVAILFSVQLCRWLDRHFSMRIMKWTGRNTLQIYVLHRIFIEFFAMVAILLAGHYQLFANALFAWSWAALFPLLMVAISVGCSLVAWSLLNRGIGRTLFIYPRLLHRQSQVAKGA
ncbi:acyltransferase [Izhakiella australiensis]|uniref:Acyltransferase n=1 Tax=Izhakiella australiensis TaxID=1926881 RepID=A0A1S8YP53_9GAMM|nr:acyltransferase family protein [Izhakiella australiensis]OON40556.1 acyltransferase [Izhakiella australiensis]